MDWATVEQVVSDLGLTSDPKDVRSVLQELKAERLKLHPDQSGGQFRSDADKDRYHAVDSAIEFCERQSQMLVPLSIATALVREIVETIAPAIRDSLEARIGRLVSAEEARVRDRFRFRRVSLGAVTAVLGFLFFFPQQIRDHPFLGILMSAPVALPLWLLAVTLVALAWVYLWAQERKVRGLISRLFSLDFHRSVLNDLRRSVGPEFSRSQLREELQRYGSSEGLYDYIETATMDEATDVAIARYLEWGWTRRIRRKDIDEWFEILV